MAKWDDWASRSMPDSWPILEGHDFCRGTFHEGDRHCLFGWMSHIGGKLKPRGLPDFYDAVSIQAEALGAKSSNDSVSVINDDVRNPKSLQSPACCSCRVWA